MRYLCCQCRQEFPSKVAIDGFPRGYTKGFLCPHCDSNIEDAPPTLATANQIFGKSKYLALAFVLVGMSAVHLFRSGTAIDILGNHLATWLIAIVMLAVIGAALAIKYPAVVFNQLVLTQAVAVTEAPSTKDQ